MADTEQQNCIIPRYLPFNKFFVIFELKVWEKGSYYIDWGKKANVIW